MNVEHPLLGSMSSALATPLPRVLRPKRALPADSVRPTRAEVNLANLRHNLRVVQRHAGSAQVWAVLKADGYGHGAKAIARTLERAGANSAYFRWDSGWRRYEAQENGWNPVYGADPDASQPARDTPIVDTLSAAWSRNARRP